MNFNNTTIIAFSVALLLGCANSPKSSSKKVETPKILLSKSNAKDKKQYIDQKMNDLNIWWQQLEEPTLMLLIKKSQDNHLDTSAAKSTLNKYFKDNSYIYISQSEINNLKNSQPQISSSYWYELRTSLSAEVTRQFIIYHFNRAQLNLLNDYSSLTNTIQSNSQIDNITRKIHISLNSLELLTKIKNKELEKMLLNNSLSIGEKIINNSLPITIPTYIEASVLEQRSDIYLNMLNLQKTIFNSTKNKAFPLISLEGKITVNDDDSNIKINTKFKDSNENLEVEYSEVENSYQKLKKDLDEISKELSIQLKLLYETNEKLNHIAHTNKLILEKIKGSQMNNKHIDMKDISIEFISNSLNMISIQEQRNIQWIDFYKTIGSSF